MKRWQLYVVVGVSVLVAVIGVVAFRSDRKPGDPAVYDQIEATTDCGQLRQMEDSSLAAVGRGEDKDLMRADASYLNAIRDRKEKLGC